MHNLISARFFHISEKKYKIVDIILINMIIIVILIGEWSCVQTVQEVLSEDEVMMTSSRGVVYCAPPVVHIEVFVNKLKYNELQASKV